MAMFPSSLPGWFGKLPGMGDFAHRRLPEAFRAQWDPWLQNGLIGLRQRHADWTEHYLESPLWSFMLGEQVASAGRWIGVLMPSVDGVGRYFPFTLASEINVTEEALRGDALAQARRWWALGTRAALDGLENDLDPARFDTTLQQLFEPDAAAPPVPDEDVCPLPAAGHSLWLTHPNGEPGWRVHSRGLPAGERFDALFGFMAEPSAGEVEEAT
jgi:type VI secretion system protein ImpM